MFWPFKKQVPIIPSPVDKTPLQEKVDDIVSIIDNQNDESRFSRHKSYIMKLPDNVITFNPSADSYFEIGDGVWLRWGAYSNVCIAYDQDSSGVDIFNDKEAKRILEAISRLCVRVKAIKVNQELNYFKEAVLK